MKILTIANEKGGVGKTLIAVQFAYYCAQKFGLRVGLIDFDQQSNSTTALIKNNSAKLSKITATELLVRESSILKNLIEEDLKGASSIVCFGADNDLSEVERLGSDLHNQFFGNFTQNLQLLTPYFDILIIDTNPNPDIRSNLALLCATHLVSPLQLNGEAIDGIARLISRLDTLSQINKALTLDTGFIGMLPNMLKSASSFQVENAENLFAKSEKLMIKWNKTSLVYRENSNGVKSPVKDDSGNYVIQQKEHFCAIPEANCIMVAQSKGTPLWSMPGADKAWSAMKIAFFQILSRINPERADNSTPEQMAVFNKALALYGENGKEIIKNFFMTDSSSSLPGMNPAEQQLLRELKASAPLSIVL